MLSLARGEVKGMKRPRIYVDTSVIGGCQDIEFARESCLLLDLARRGDICLLISNLLVQELRQAPAAVRETLSTLSERSTERVGSTRETESLRDSYLAEGVVGQSASNDAHHVAIATVHGADMIVSWNFRHIVHYDKIRHFNSINLRQGYGIIEMYSPKEVV